MSCGHLVAENEPRTQTLGSDDQVSSAQHCVSSRSTPVTILTPSPGSRLGTQDYGQGTLWGRGRGAVLFWGSHLWVLSSGPTLKESQGRGST